VANFTGAADGASAGSEAS